MSTPERDYPESHPAAQDYKPGNYTPPESPLKRDWPLGHPKNAESPENLAETAARHAEVAKAEGRHGEQSVLHGVQGEDTGDDAAKGDGAAAAGERDAGDWPLGHPKNAESPENLTETAARHAEVAKAEGRDGEQPVLHDIQGEDTGDDAAEGDAADAAG